jgi:hypothetical protein
MTMSTDITLSPKLYLRGFEGNVTSMDTVIPVQRGFEGNVTSMDTVIPVQRGFEGNVTSVDVKCLLWKVHFQILFIQDGFEIK